MAPRELEKQRAATAVIAVEAGEFHTLPAACVHYGAGLEDARNMKKKWLKHGTLAAHVQAHKERQPPPLDDSAQKQTLSDVVKQMRAGLSVRKAAAVCQSQGIQIQKSALHKRMTGETQRDTAGAPPKLPVELLKDLVRYVEAVKVTFRIPVFMCQIRAWVQRMIEGTPHQLKFKDGIVTMDWVRYFIKHQLGGMSKITPLEFNRAKWFTSKNIQKYYEIYRDTVLELKLASLAPESEYNPLEPLSQEIIHTKPERIMEIDEARVKTDMTKDQSGNLKTVKTFNPFDTNEAVVNKGGNDATLVGGSKGNGDSVIPCLITAGAEPTDEEKLQGPRSTVRDPLTFERLGCKYTSNKKGGMTWDLMILYVTLCIIPMFPDLSPDNPILLLFDGHGSHMTLAFIMFCKGKGIMLLLKPPHTTHRMQTCDVYNFRY